MTLYREQFWHLFVWAGVVVAAGVMVAWWGHEEFMAIGIGGLLVLAGCGICAYARARIRAGAIEVLWDDTGLDLTAPGHAALRLARADLTAATVLRVAEITHEREGGWRATQRTFVVFTVASEIGQGGAMDRQASVHCGRHHLWIEWQGHTMVRPGLVHIRAAIEDARIPLHSATMSVNIKDDEAPDLDRPGTVYAAAD